jgi:metal-responsive CopG/Arc/MetJ family transcriptional regulator
MQKEKRGRGRPPAEIRKAKVIVYLEPELIESLDEWVGKEKTNRSEFIAMILKRSIHRRAVKDSL